MTNRTEAQSIDAAPPEGWRKRGASAGPRGGVCCSARAVAAERLENDSTNLANLSLNKKMKKECRNRSLKEKLGSRREMESDLLH